MSNYATVELDTQPPAAPSLVAPASTEVSDIVVSVGTEDVDVTGYKMKLWGEVDPDVNPSIQLTEEESTWINFQTSLVINMLIGQEERSLFLKLRDDVWNETSVREAVIQMLHSAYGGQDPRSFTYAGGGPGSYIGLGPASYPDQDESTYQEAIDESPRESDYGT